MIQARTNRDIAGNWVYGWSLFNDLVQGYRDAFYQWDAFLVQEKQTIDTFNVFLSGLSAKETALFRKQAYGTIFETQRVASMLIPTSSCDGTLSEARRVALTGRVSAPLV